MGTPGRLAVVTRDGAMRVEGRGEERYRRGGLWRGVGWTDDINNVG